MGSKVDSLLKKAEQLAKRERELEEERKRVKQQGLAAVRQAKVLRAIEEREDIAKIHAILVPWLIEHQKPATPTTRKAFAAHLESHPQASRLLEVLKRAWPVEKATPAAVTQPPKDTSAA